MAPAAASGPSVTQRPAAQIAVPAAGTSVTQPALDAGATQSKPAVTTPRRKATSSGNTTSVGTVGRVTPPKKDEPGHASNDQIGGVLVCTDISKPCSPPPPGGGAGA